LSDHAKRQPSGTVQSSNYCSCLFNLAKKARSGGLVQNPSEAGRREKGGESLCLFLISGMHLHHICDFITWLSCKLTLLTATGLG